MIADVLVYHIPLRSSSVPAFAIQHGVVDPSGLAIDSHGDLTAAGAR